MQSTANQAKVALWAMLEAKPGKEQALEDFLRSALPLANAEPQTSSWFAMRIGPSQFGIFDTFADETGRKAHLDGQIAKMLMEKASELLATAPNIQHVDILAAKLP